MADARQPACLSGYLHPACRHQFRRSVALILVGLRILEPLLLHGRSTAGAGSDLAHLARPVPSRKSVPTLVTPVPNALVIDAPEQPSRRTEGQPMGECRWTAYGDDMIALL